MVYDYRCISCSAVVTKIRKLAEMENPCECTECGKNCIRAIIKAPLFALDPICGDFHQAAENWGKHRAQKQAKEARENKEHGGPSQTV